MSYPVPLKIHFDGNMKISQKTSIIVKKKKKKEKRKTNKQTKKGSVYLYTRSCFKERIFVYKN